VLPAPALRTGLRWSVLIENCFFQARGAAAAAPASTSASSSAAAAAAAASRDTKLYRVRTSHGGGALTGSWLLTPSMVLEGGAPMDRFLDTAGGSSSGGGGGAQGSAAEASPVHVKSVVALSGDEWLLGDVVLRLATCKLRDKLQSVLVLELEQPACTSPSHEAARPLFELAAQLGVPLTADAMAAASFQSGAARIAANLGLAHAAVFTPAHAALQYVVLGTILSNSAQPAHNA